ncbi:hypothetical protein LTR09_012533 [Extremus antarcticus]|uniref:Transcription factor domain-containing protein n=1 Tax=Extremus antarcticus TaxID=702011 RepID=A0AAJ0D4Y7_9PEZI|nr:hypothetical protein LTR09_012533 [Extremus antarcticus]
MSQQDIGDLSHVPDTGPEDVIYTLGSSLASPSTDVDLENGSFDCSVHSANIDTNTTPIAESDPQRLQESWTWPLSPGSVKLLSPPLDSLPERSAELLKRHHCGTESFEFLLNFEMGGGINRVFNFYTSLESDYLNLDYNESSLELLFVGPTHADSPGTDSDICQIQSTQWLFDPLLPHAKAVWEQLPHLSRSGISEHTSTGQLATNQCIEFFNPKNLRRLLGLYWTNWHFHCPIVHQATLNVLELPMEMVVVMALLGACVSCDDGDVSKARQWLDPVEELIFAHPWLSKDKSPDVSESVHLRLTKLRMLQTALLICVLQTWEGTEAARLRVRELRYTRLVKVCF